MVDPIGLLPARAVAAALPLILVPAVFVGLKPLVGKPLIGDGGIILPEPSGRKTPLTSLASTR